MSDKPAATPAPTPPATPAATPAPAAPAAPAASVNKQPILRAFMTRIGSGEFDLAGGKDFHEFVVKEIYQLLADGTLGVDDLEKLTKTYAARNDPYNKEAG